MNEEIFSISKDPARARALKEMAEERLNDMKADDKPYRKVEEYYEIIKELITALMYEDGFKTLSHKKLVEYLKENYDFDRKEITLIDETRKLRNDILYYGKKISSDFLVNKEETLKNVIKKLFSYGNL